MSPHRPSVQLRKHPGPCPGCFCFADDARFQPPSDRKAHYRRLPGELPGYAGVSLANASPATSIQHDVETPEEACRNTTSRPTAVSSP